MSYVKQCLTNHNRTLTHPIPSVNPFITNPFIINHIITLSQHPPSHAPSQHIRSHPPPSQHTYLYIPTAGGDFHSVEWVVPDNTIISTIRVQLVGVHTLTLRHLQILQGNQSSYRSNRSDATKAMLADPFAGDPPCRCHYIYLALTPLLLS